MRSWLPLVLCACVVPACAAGSGASGRPAQRDAAAASGDDAGRVDDDAGSLGDSGGTQSGLCTSCGGCDEPVQVTSANHGVGTVHYDSLPPAGGDHNQCWGSWGVHDKTLAPERWVHNLEHGGIVLLYNCPSGCPADVAKLATFVKARPRALLTADTDMPTMFAIVAWGQRLKTDCLDLAAFATFYTSHVDHAPESIPDGPPTGCPK
jgi:hypothetical protein